jgi:hypothetical protein
MTHAMAATKKKSRNSESVCILIEMVLLEARSGSELSDVRLTRTLFAQELEIRVHSLTFLLKRCEISDRGR